jgi:hypothetical protein
MSAELEAQAAAPNVSADTKNVLLATFVEEIHLVSRPTHGDIIVAKCGKREALGAAELLGQTYPQGSSESGSRRSA